MGGARAYATTTRASVSNECLVETALGFVEPFSQKHLDGVGGAVDDPLGIVLGREVGEDVVGEVAWVAASGPADAAGDPGTVEG